MMVLEYYRKCANKFRPFDHVNYNIIVPHIKWKDFFGPYPIKSKNLSVLRMKFLHLR